MSLSECFAIQIASGDRLVSVDMISVKGLNHHDIMRMARGPAGTRVTLGFDRGPADGRGATQDAGPYFVTLERALPPPSFMPAFGSPRRGLRPLPSRTYIVL